MRDSSKKPVKPKNCALHSKAVYSKNHRLSWSLICFVTKPLVPLSPRPASERQLLWAFSFVNRLLFRLKT